MTRAPTLSLVVPVYNAAPYIAGNLVQILDALEALDDSFEVLVVCDGPTDGTAEAAASVIDPRLRVLPYERNRGKGFAICHGVAKARGRLVGWLDADLDISPEVIVTASRRFQHGEVDAVIGSKRHPDSEVDYPLVRRVLSAGFQLLVRLLFRVRVRDTQVGAKLFRREMLETVVPLLLIKEYAFDVELLAVGAEFGFDRIEETPVRLDYRFTGTGINRQSVRRMFFDTLAVAYRIHLRHWYVRQFAALHRQRADAATRLESRRVAPPAANWSEITSARG